MEDRGLRAFRRLIGVLHGASQHISRRDIAFHRLTISAPVLADHETLQPDDPDVSTHEQRSNKNLRFQIVSDLHLERYLKDDQYHCPFEITQSAPILILAGDIGRFCDRIALYGFLRAQCEKFERVVFVLGNHEFYGVSQEEGLRVAAHLAQEERGYWGVTRCPGI